MVVGLAIGGLWSGGLDGWRRGRSPGRTDGIEQERVVGEAGIPFATIGIEDPQRRPTPGRTVAVVGDERLRALADDIATQADPRSAGQLEADAGRLIDRRGEATGEARRIEDEEQGLRAASKRRESMESIGDPCRLVRPRHPATGQVQHEHVHRATGQQAPRDAEPFVQAGRGDHDEPLETEAAGDGLDRVEGA